MADQYSDMREIVLRAAYPDGIRPEEYGRAANIIGSITVGRTPQVRVGPTRRGIWKGCYK